MNEMATDWSVTADIFSHDLKERVAFTSKTFMTPIRTSAINDLHRKFIESIVADAAEKIQDYLETQR
jgi:hypothetical protein